MWWGCGVGESFFPMQLSNIFWSNIYVGQYVWWKSNFIQHLINQKLFDERVWQTVKQCWIQQSLARALQKAISLVTWNAVALLSCKRKLRRATVPLGILSDMVSRTMIIWILIVYKFNPVSPPGTEIKWFRPYDDFSFA